jgi:thymidylate kinase
MLVIFIGIDGSGKTTYALKLYQELKVRGIKCKYIHFDSLFAYKLLNTINNIANLTKKERVAPKDLSAKRSSFVSIVKGTILFLILVIDDIFFYLLRLKGEEKEIVICDRYFYDSAISCIYSGARESFIYKIYRKIFPLPDMIFLLDIDPSIAYSRKQEDSVNYLACKREIYLNLYLIIQCRKIKIDSSNLFNKSFAVVRDKVLELLGDNK